MSGLTKTSIPYLDAVWNVTTGCSPVGAGCDNCYAARLAATRLCHNKRYLGLAHETITGQHVWTGEVRRHHDRLDAPIRASKPLVIGVSFMGDLFNYRVPVSFLDEVFSRICKSPYHKFLILTKRPERMRSYLSKCEWYADGWMHLALGVSCWDQASAERMIPILLDTPAACRVVSLEPLLDPVDLTGIPMSDGDHLSESTLRHPLGAGIDWVIVGGETGPSARPMNPWWAFDLKDQCRFAGVPFWFKQWGVRFAEPDQLLAETERTHELPEALKLEAQS